MKKKLTIARQRLLELTIADARTNLSVLRWDIVWVQPLAMYASDKRFIDAALSLVLKIRRSERNLETATRELEKAERA